MIHPAFLSFDSKKDRSTPRPRYQETELGHPAIVEQRVTEREMRLFGQAARIPF
jgi:hypothetical protein